MRKKAFIIVGSILVVGGLYMAVDRAVRMKAQALPDNNPEVCRSPDFNPQRMKVVVAVGDSITHGRVSANYVDELTSRRSGSHVFINAGINSELAYNALQRVKDIAACKPDFVTILIGTNDVNAKISPESEERYIKNMKLPRPPDRDWYRENLNALVSEIRSSTGAKIALMTLPPIGEDPLSRPNHLVRQYNQIIRETAAAQKTAALPLNERMSAQLKKFTANNRCQSNEELLVAMAVAQHFILRKSWNEISEFYSFHYLTDCLHMNEKGSRLAADLIEEFIVKQ